MRPLLVALVLLAHSHAGAQEPAAVEPTPPVASAPPTEPADSRPSLAQEVAGFRFGWSEAEVIAACRTAGHRWREGTRPGSGACTGTAASIGYPAMVMVSFCDGRACGMGLALDLNGDAAVLSAIEDLRHALGVRYGAPSFEPTGSQHCQESFARGHTACVSLGDLALRWRWVTWHDGLVVLSLTGREGRMDVMLSYFTPLARQQGAQDRRSL